MQRKRNLIFNNLFRPAPAVRNKKRALALKKFSTNNILFSANNSKKNSELQSSSPLNLDVSHEELASEYLGRDSELIAKQYKTMDKIIHKSQNTLNEELETMSSNAAKLNPNEKIKLQESYNEMANLEQEYALEDLNKAAATRDDVLSLNVGERRNSIGSDYSSSYESQTSINEFNNIDANDSSYNARLVAMVENTKKTFSNLIFKPEDLPSSSTKETSDKELEPETSNKRKRLESEEPLDKFSNTAKTDVNLEPRSSKRIKQDSSDVLPGDEPFDFSDDT
jgi:hypothetical protein